MKKKILRIVLCCLLVVLVAGGAVLAAVLPHPINYPIDSIASAGVEGVQIVAEDADSVTLQKTVPGDFKVLMFTDMHLAGNNKTSRPTIENFIRAVQEEKPDFVLLGGDNVTGGLTGPRTRQLAEMFEKLGVYWGGVIGNHEGDNKFSITRAEMVDRFASYDHCVMRRGLDSVEGDCNYKITLQNADGKTVQTIFCLDTYDEITDEDAAAHNVPDDFSHYDGAHESQLQWYRDSAAALKRQDPNARSILLIHIPPYETRAAAEEGTFLYGDKRENCCVTAYDNGTFAAVRDSDVTQAVFFGHDHVNNFGLMLDGILLSYIEPSGYSAYGLHTKGFDEKDWLQGYTKLTIGDDGVFEQEQVRYSVAYAEE